MLWSSLTYCLASSAQEVCWAPPVSPSCPVALDLSLDRELQQAQDSSCFLLSGSRCCLRSGIFKTAVLIFLGCSNKIPGGSNQSILNEINPECSLKGLMLKLMRQYFGHLMGRANSLEKTLILGEMEGRRKRGQQMIRWLDGITDSMDMS